MDISQIKITSATQVNTDFARDIKDGLNDRPKKLSSKYFYDEKGSKIFQDIMRMPEYYLTDCELEIFLSQKQEILNELSGMYGILAPGENLQNDN